jgi:cell division protein FtsA
LDSEKSISIPAEGGFSGQVVRSSALHAIINARMEETFLLIAEQIEEQGFSGVLNAGILLTGGGSAMEGAADLARQVFNAPAHIGRVRDCTGLATKREGARFSSVLGCVRYAASQLDDEPKSKMGLSGWVSTLWGGGSRG